MRGKNTGFHSGFRRRGAPAPPPKPQEYIPQRSALKPRGYAEIEAASHLQPDAPEWADFVRDIVQMSPEMTPAIQEAIRGQKWKIAPNPVGAIRTAAHQEAKRMGIEPNPPGIG